MTPQEYADLLEYIKANNGWNLGMYEVCCIRKRRAIKYVKAIFDSRDGTIWKVEFHSQTHGKDKIFKIEDNKEEDIKAIYKWLDETVE